jgi:hypothetical protein
VHRPLRVDSADGMRAGERKTGWTKPLPPSPGLWALNASGLLLAGHRGIQGGGLEPFAVPTRLSSGQHSLDWTIWPSGRNADGARGASVPAPAWRALRACAVGTSLLGHDVSGTGRQTVGRMMLSITTMVPA